MNRNPLKPAGGGYTSKSRGPMTDAVRSGDMGAIKGAISSIRRTDDLGDLSKIKVNNERAPPAENWLTQDHTKRYPMPKTYEQRRDAEKRGAEILKNKWVANQSHTNPDKLNGSPMVNKGTLPNASMAVDNLSSAKQGVRGSLSMLAQ